MKAIISAIICTRNRSDFLKKAIISLDRQTLLKRDYEIVIVDNGSSDNTRSLIGAFAGIQNLRYVFEPRTGLSHSRNTGFRSAQGTYIAFMDDDAVAASDWLERIIDAFEKLDALPGCVSGKVVPIWETQRPPWLGDDLLPYLSILNWSDSPITLSPDQWFAGTNMAFHCEILKAFDGFNIELGRKDRKLLSGEETFLKMELERKGYRSFYFPEIEVRHHLAANRLTKAWFVRRAFWHGISNAVIHINHSKPSHYLRIRGSIMMVLPIFTSRVAWKNLLGLDNDPGKFAAKCKTIARLSFAIGSIPLRR